MMADILIVSLAQPRFTWGRRGLRTADETRHAYIEALRTADDHDFTALLRFARS